MKKLLNWSLKKIMIYTSLVLIISIPIYYIAVSKLWKYELDEHNIILTPEAWKEDRFLIIGAVTLLTVLFFILLMGGFVLLNRSISRRLWQPFYQSLEQIRNFDLLQQNKTIEFPETDIAEFSELNQSLQKLIAGNVAAYKQQKEFADNASHELQTPLAIVQSKLELLLQSKELTNEQYTIVEETLAALARVSRINKNLLLLTKIENSEFMGKNKIDLSDTLQSTIALLNGFFEVKQLSLETSIHPAVMVEGNKILVEVLLNNILTNAIRHSQDGSFMSVRLSAHDLEVSNNGLSPLKAEYLFKRFTSASSQASGTGLGLAIAKQICDRYGWKIGYTFLNSMHVFTIQFNSNFLPNQVLPMQELILQK